ncbi:MAG: 3-dehydroquinate synthase [Actinomycetota bacterium]|nr:3-dehydroquinate synthase [Actinomycetota bacterium]
MIVLVGFMGAGKSTTGRLLAERLGLPFVDTDALIESQQGASIPKLFAREGELGFRRIESRTVTRVLEGPEAVVALGGGAVTDPATCSALEWAKVVYLDVSFGEALSRLQRDGADRPMLTLHDPKALYDDRAGVYGRIADITLAADGRRPDDIAGDIATALGVSPRRSDGLDRVPVHTVPPYEVLVGWGLTSRITELCPPFPDAEAVVVAHQPPLQEVAESIAYAFEASGLRSHVVELADGESAKSLDGAEVLFERLADTRIHRHDLLVAVGGGAATDVVGFVASTYNRGMSVVHVPSSLLAQVDAAVGGKTAVNLDHGKNLVGTFHQPAVVICDVELLRSLPDPEFASGMAEVVKYGLIAEPSLLDFIAVEAEHLRDRDGGALASLVARSVAIKAGIVGRDAKEAGERAWLNYGHTFAHAIERVAGYGAMRHGEAVALGMMAAAYTAEELGRLDPSGVEMHRKALDSAGLPTAARFDLAALEDAWSHDKKYRRGVRFVLLAGIGLPEAGVHVPRAALAAAFERMAAGA